MARVSSQQGGIGPVPSIDAFAPAYGQPLSGPPVSGLGDNGIAQRATRNAASTFRTRCARGRGRRDSRCGKTARSSVNRLVTSSFDIDTNTKTTYNAGMLYLAQNGLAPC